MRAKRVVLVLLAAALLSSNGCASLGTTRHRATVTVASAHAMLAALQDGEMLLVCGRPTAPAAPTCVTLERHREISKKLVTAFDYDEKVARLVRDMPATAPTPASAGEWLGKIGVLIDDVLALIPDSSAKRALTAKAGVQ